MPDIGPSARKALGQFLHNERKLTNNDSARQQYVEFFPRNDRFKTYRAGATQQRISTRGLLLCASTPCSIQRFSTTTKCRAVFNASAKTSNGNSLNDCLLIGPKQQPDLYSILVRFRFLNVALTGDVTKMYRQVILNEKDRNFHQIYWRSDPSKPIEKWRLTRVIYGVASSSYHAIRALRD